MASIEEELAMDNEHILKYVITRTRKMKNMEDKEEAGSEEWKKKEFLI